MTRDLIQKIFSIIEVTGVEEVEEEDQKEEQLRSLLLSTIWTVCH
jgi:CII-binding regulator of phage lambda lysogenization HflD